MIGLFKQYKLLATGAVVLALMALSAAAAWQWQANSYGTQLATQHAEHLDYLRRAAEANAAVILQQQGEQQALAARLANLDIQSIQELSDALTENDRLRHLYSAADNERRRLRIEVILARNDATVSATTGAGSLGDAASVELSAAAGSAVWDIRAGMISDREKLLYLQEWVRQIRKTSDQSAPSNGP